MLVKYKKLILLIYAVILSLALLLIPTIVEAASDTVVQSYAASGNLQYGSIVKLNSDKTVSAINLDSINSMYGVVVSPNNTPFSLQNQTPNAPTQAYVATTGTYPVLVSTQNGNIHIGDYVTVSNLSGIGMKADTTQSLVLGVALSGFDGTNLLGTATIQGKNGKYSSISLGSITLAIGVTKNPLAPNGTGNIPKFLQQFTKFVTAKPVSTVRVYAAFAVFLIAVIVSAGLLFSGVKNSLTAIGRNPLSKKSVIRGLIQVIIVSIIILVTGIVAVYLLLKL